MSRYNTVVNHPLIPNANQYYLESRYVSIHSEDRDITKYPNPSEFEIELPQDYLNVAKVSLSTWSFPANYDVFSTYSSNVSMSFSIKPPFSPSTTGSELDKAIYLILEGHVDKEYIFFIGDGFYNPTQMANELTVKMNLTVTEYIKSIIDTDVRYTYLAPIFVSYDRFQVVYNTVSQKLWFGNSADKFIFNNESPLYTVENRFINRCERSGVLPSYVGWGLPYYLGFNRTNEVSVNVEDLLTAAANTGNSLDKIIFSDIDLNTGLPRFSSGDALQTGDQGYWIEPYNPEASVFFIVSPLKINFMGPAYFYMEIAGLNCIDETSPYNLSIFSQTSNETNGVVNSAFAKIAVPTTPLSQWFDNGSPSYKYFNPPAERIRKLKIKLRYHNGQLVDFNSFDYSFMLEISMLRPQQERNYSLRDANGLGQLTSFS